MGIVIDSDGWAERLRGRVLNKESRSILVTDFTGTQQELDLTIPPNCEGLGRIRHFKLTTTDGWPSNTLPLAPASHALGLPLRSMQAQVFQNAGCNWRCWYCYVPFELLSGNHRYGVWKTAPELINLFLKERDHPSILVLSGGQPELTPEWILWTMYALEEQGVTEKVYLWSDDNLSTEFFWRHLSDDEQEHIIRYHNYGKVGCFKGFDEESFSYNTLASAQLFKRQFDIMKRYVASGLNMFAYVTLTAPSRQNMKEKMQEFVDKLQAIHESLPLRTIPLEIRQFTPVAPRMIPVHNASLINQQYAVEAWNEELLKRFDSEKLSKPIAEVVLN